ELWWGYMKDLLEDQNVDLMLQKIAAADYHGAKVTVVQSTCPSMIGISGTVVMEGRSVLAITNNGTKIVPKSGSVFRMSVPQGDDQIDVELVGNRLMFRAAERSVRKFKAKK
ncbi:hypothetical protein CANCADRAFT_14814, partial [Tortispora caseinolytica NRRL Y-17796]